jgi:hypothetical protein
MAMATATASTTATATLCVVSFTPPQASIQGGAQITGNAEFDLFNCELLESDHEDQSNFHQIRTGTRFDFHCMLLKESANVEFGYSHLHVVVYTTEMLGAPPQRIALSVRCFKTS